jgi:hypothetical protein
VLDRAGPGDNLEECWLDEKESIYVAQ